jgi:urease gamma subunit
LTLRITDEHRLDKNKVEQLANDRFAKGVKNLNKLQASGLIGELLEETAWANHVRALSESWGAMIDNSKAKWR